MSRNWPSSVIEACITRAKERAPDQFPVRVQCFAASEDNIVHRFSAWGIFDGEDVLQGDHSSVLKPKSALDERCSRLLQVLDEPPGHPNFWEIEKYETTLIVKPRPADPPFIGRYGARDERQREVRTDNVAQVIKKVTFSRKNICTDSFVLDYMTHNVNGYVRGTPWFPQGDVKGTNEWSVKEQSRWNETGRDYTFRFTPERHREYALTADVYGGFEAGNRSVDFDLGDQFFCAVYCFTLDLVAYRDAGWGITEPVLALHMDDRKTTKGRIITCTKGSAEEGVYIWEIPNIHNLGVKVSVKWDVTPPLPAQH